jgi:MFS family permease
MTGTVPATGNPETPPAPKSKVQTFRALRYRDFRLLWISLIVSSVGTWMQIVAQSLLVLLITNGSAVALGIVALAQASSFFLFALVGGSIADRVDKRRFLLVTQSLSMLLAFILGILTITGVIQVWMIVILAFCSGTVLSFDQPTRSSLIPVLVPRQDLMNAISLQSVVFNGSAVLGPALAGIAIGLLAYAGHFVGLTGKLTGYAGNFFLNGISYIGVIVVLDLISHLDGRAALVRAQSYTVALAPGAAPLRHLPEWCGSHGDYTCPIARTSSDARARNESQYSAHHGRASARGFSCQWPDRLDWWSFHRDYQRSHCGQLLALPAFRTPGNSHSAAMIHRRTSPYCADLTHFSTPVSFF